MIYNKLDSEYYIMDTDGENSHPMLAWGELDDTPFLADSPIDAKELEFPLTAEFDEPYPKKYAMPDFLKLSSEFACTQNVKSIFEQNHIYGIEFFPIESIKDDKRKSIGGYFATHIWNKLSAIDKNNYIGSKPNRKGIITDLQKFSLNRELLEALPLEKRLIFELSDSFCTFIIHKSLRDLLVDANLTGFSFFKVSEWDEDAIFR